VSSFITQRCHSRNPALDAGASGIVLKTKKDSGQAGMTDKKIAQLSAPFHKVCVISTEGRYLVLFNSN
jgi:hypothetical protein